MLEIKITQLSPELSTNVLISVTICSFSSTAEESQLKAFSFAEINVIYIYIYIYIIRLIRNIWGMSVN